jgi:hypothetical protein
MTETPSNKQRTTPLRATLLSSLDMPEAFNVVKFHSKADSILSLSAL